VAALSDDDAWAEQVLAAQRRGTARAGAAGVPMTHWSPEYERLTDLFDRVGELIRAVAMAGGGKPGRVHPAPRPTTALERIRRRQARQQHRRLVGTLLPGRDSAPP